MDKRNTGGPEAMAPAYEVPRGKRRGSVRANVLTPYLFMVPYLILFVSLCLDSGILWDLDEPPPVGLFCSSKGMGGAR